MFGSATSRLHCANAMLPLIWMFLAIPCLVQQAAGQETPSTPSTVVDFARDIAPVFKAKCFECHQGSDAKGGFDVTDKDSVLGYITAGSLEKSALWTDHLTADPTQKDSLIMPPTSKEKLKPSELALLRTWIEEGAVWNLTDTPFPLVDIAEGPKRSLPERVWVFVGYFHPAIVHFPIALISVAALSLVFSLFTGKRAEDFAVYCLVLGAIGAVASVTLGWSLAATQGYPSWTATLESQKDPTFFWHRLLGVATTFLCCLFALIAILFRNKPKWNVAWKLGLLLVAAMVGFVGHQGGELTFGEKFFDEAVNVLTK